MWMLRRSFVIGAVSVAAVLAAVGLRAQGGDVARPTPAAAARTQSPSDAFTAAESAALFGTYCAICHEGPGANPQAPTLEVMRRMSAEQILDSLEKGAMRTRAAERSRAQRRALAVYVSGKSLAAESRGPMPASAYCSAAQPSRSNPLAGPSWNGWGHSLTNNRFQSATDAGLTAEDLPGLTLKWAFGFPAATSAGTQPVVAGGRLYAATAEGEVYALDAKTGCVHWTLEVEASIRSAITLDQRANGLLVAYFADQAANVYAIDAKVGKVLWKVDVDDHPHAAITAAPQLYNGRLYVPVSSREESQVGDARYPAARFVAAWLRSMPPPESNCGRPTRWPSRLFPRRRTASARNSTDQPAAPSGTRRRSMPGGTSCTWGPETIFRRRPPNSRTRSWRST